MSLPKVELGRVLFKDRRLSLNNTTSCADCHDPQRAFTDGRARAVGATGEVHRRNTPTLINVAYSASFGWTNAGIESLEAQVIEPLTNGAPIEMGFSDDLLRPIEADGKMAQLHRAAFGSSAMTLTTVTRALAAYVRSLIVANTPFDRYLFFDDPLPSPAKRGMQLFFDARFKCASCHVGITFSGPISLAGNPKTPPVFHIDDGLQLRAPTLRELLHTGPYLHDGRAKTLRAVFERYDTGASDTQLGDLEAFVVSLSSLPSNEPSEP